MTKKKRFEIFKRDGFQCAYCGQKPPAVVLEVDHIHPRSKGGKDNVDNLLTACFDCNRGKSDRLLGNFHKNISKQEIRLLKEKEEQLKEYNDFKKVIEERIREDINIVYKMFKDDYGENWKGHKFKNVTIRSMLLKLPASDLIEAMNITMGRIQYSRDDAMRYFCGVCKRMIRGQT